MCVHRKILITICTALSRVIGCPDNCTDAADTERDVREFLDSYAEDLRAHHRDALGDRYDRRGAYRLGDGKKLFNAFDAIKELYQNQWIGPSSFEWKDVSVEVLSPVSAVVICCFEWRVPTAEETKTYSYTALLVKYSKEWRIRLEDESAGPVQ